MSLDYKIIKIKFINENPLQSQVSKKTLVLRFISIYHLCIACFRIIANLFFSFNLKHSMYLVSFFQSMLQQLFSLGSNQNSNSDYNWSIHMSFLYSFLHIGVWVCYSFCFCFFDNDPVLYCDMSSMNSKSPSHQPRLIRNAIQK